MADNRRPCTDEFHNGFRRGAEYVLEQLSNLMKTSDGE
jgi:hypothetical protein